jgi:hypothetical protein
VSVRSAPGVGVDVGLDALLAHLAADRAVLGDRVLLDAHALLGDGALLDDGLLGGVTCSVTTYLRRRTWPLSREALPTTSSSSERVIASSVVGPDVSWPTVPRASFPGPRSGPPAGRPESERPSE